MECHDWKSYNQCIVDYSINNWFITKLKRLTLFVRIASFLYFLCIENLFYLLEALHFSVLALITIWILNALYLGLIVFISDFCVSPEEYTIELGNYNGVKPSKCN